MSQFRIINLMILVILGSFILLPVSYNFALHQLVNHSHSTSRIVDNLYDHQCSIQETVDSNINLLYLYNASNENYQYDDFERLFSHNERISLSGIGVSEFSEDPTVTGYIKYYHVLIVGYSAFHWRYSKKNTTIANAIINPDKPVLALGRGGSTFLSSLDQYSGGMMSFGCAGLNVTQNHEIFSQTYHFTVPGTIILNGSGHNTVSGPHRPPNGDDEFLAYDTYRVDYAPFVEITEYSQKMLYIGFWYTPSFQSALFMLIHNCIEWLSNQSASIQIPSSISNQLPISISTTSQLPTSVVLSSSHRSLGRPGDVPLLSLLQIFEFTIIFAFVGIMIFVIRRHQPP